MTNIMLDIETLGIKPGCVVLSIGAVRFNLDGLHESFYVILNQDAQLVEGFHTAKDTLDWWSRQSYTAREALLKSKISSSSILPAKALQSLADFINQFDKPREIWHKRSAFDAPILDPLFLHFGVKVPWHYWNVNCVASFFRTSRYKVGRPSDGHNALSDARYQAETLIEIFKDNPNLTLGE